jgi:hypothetical protein
MKTGQRDGLVPASKQGFEPEDIAGRCSREVKLTLNG